MTTLGELASRSKGVLCDALGRATGEKLYNAIRGIDDKKLESDKPRKSVSCEINVSADNSLLLGEGGSDLGDMLVCIVRNSL